MPSGKFYGNPCNLLQVSETAMTGGTLTGQWLAK